jgi:hypothetical protein
MKFLLVLASVFLMLGCSAPVFDKEPDAVETNSLEVSGQLEAQEGLSYNFGDIDIQGGVVSQAFSFANRGTDPLYIYEATTSCGCTTGEIITEENTYGPFAMNRTNQNTITIDPQETFSVNISYDPLFHGPNDLGQRQRTLFLFTSAAADGTTVRPYEGRPNFTEMSVSGNVVSGD